MNLKDNVLNARDMHAVTKVMKTQLIDTSIYNNIRKRALDEYSYYVTSHISPETIASLRILGYTVTESQSDVRWVVIEW